MVTPAIEIVDVSLAYGTFLAVEHLSLSVEPGSVLGLVGRNGAGKSTTIALLAGLLEPTSGQVRISGMDFETEALAIKRLCGYLVSEEALFAYLTAFETLSFVAEAFGVDPAERTRRVADMIAFFGLAEAEDFVVAEYSTGMRKRLALAAALVHAPRVLILDEPFESLDPLMVRRLKRLLADFAAHGGTVMLSSHLLDAVAEIGTHIAILERGHLLVHGPAREAIERAAAARSTEPSLEALYASVVPDAAAPTIEWLHSPE
jgi:ABC-2 type transport system ATP-binding protein